MPLYGQDPTHSELILAHLYSALLPSVCPTEYATLQTYFKGFICEKEQYIILVFIAVDASIGHAHVAQWGKCWTLQPTSMWQPGLSCFGGDTQGQMTSVQQGRPCPALGQVKRLMLSPASCPEFPSRMVDVRITATSNAQQGF